MKIFYDYQAFTIQKYGGVSRYFCDLLKGLKASRDLDIIVQPFFSNNYHLRGFTNTHRPFLSDINFRGKIRAQSLLNSYLTKQWVKKNEFDIYHPTYYDPYLIEQIPKVPLVVTVHDMIHEKFQNIFPRKDSTALWKKRLIERAAKIIAISENTKRDLIELLGIEHKKIAIVYHGNSMKLVSLECTLHHPPNRYILFVGNRDSYKNFTRFVEAVEPLMKEDDELTILCCGGGPFTSEEIFFFNKYGIRNRFRQENCDDSTFACYYQNATLFVFPSIYEGFGMPLLEAFSCDCPVAASNTSSLPEIAGDAAIFFDPYDIQSIYKALKSIYHDQSLRKSLIEKGRKRLKNFTWAITAKKTKEVYMSLL